MQTNVSGMKIRKFAGSLKYIIRTRFNSFFDSYPLNVEKAHAGENEAEITQRFRRRILRPFLFCGSLSGAASATALGLRAKRETDLPSVFEKENEL